MKQVSLNIDHIGILGDDIDVLVDEFASIGFSIVGPAELTAVDTSGTTHSLGQRSAHIMFGNDYIELTAVSSTDPEHHLANYLQSAPGIRLLILSSNNIQATHERCDLGEMQPGDIQRAARDITYGTPGRAEFSWFGLPARLWPDALVAFVQHESSEIVFQADAARHANRANGLRRLLYVGDAGPAEFERLSFGVAHSIQCVSAAEFRSATGFDYHETSPLAALVVGTDDLQASERSLEASGAPITKLQNGIATQMASGICLVFEPAEPD